MKKYQIIYSDPPYQFKTWSKKGLQRSAENHYETMDLENICALPVSEIADENCILFLWATFPNLPAAFEVIKAWGFEYKTVAFCWVKKNKKSEGLFWGMGRWTRANAEICLLATKGNVKRVSAKVHQVIHTPVEQHSKKPDEARDRIIELVGDLPRVELFARSKAEGWDAWGNEVLCDIDLHSL